MSKAERNLQQSISEHASVAQKRRIDRLRQDQKGHSQPSSPSGAPEGSSSSAPATPTKSSFSRVTTNDGRQAMLTLQAQTTFSELQRSIAHEFALPPAQQCIRYGFPPKELYPPKDGEENEPVALQHGDCVTVEILRGPGEKVGGVVRKKEQLQSVTAFQGKGHSLGSAPPPPGSSPPEHKPITRQHSSGVDLSASASQGPDLSDIPEDATKELVRMAPGFVTMKDSRHLDPGMIEEQRRKLQEMVSSIQASMDRHLREQQSLVAAAAGGPTERTGGAKMAAPQPAPSAGKTATGSHRRWTWRRRARWRRRRGVSRWGGRRGLGSWRKWRARMQSRPTPWRPWITLDGTERGERCSVFAFVVMTPLPRPQLVGITVCVWGLGGMHQFVSTVFSVVN